jgi:hypothetical protein
MSIRLDLDRVPRLLRRDVASTLSDALLRGVADVVAIVHALTNRDGTGDSDARGDDIGDDDPLSADEAQRYFDRKVVDDFQQFVHDTRVNTTWPACPKHFNHPLNYDEAKDSWCCPRDRTVIARLGALRLP